MGIQFTKATKRQAKLRMAIDGPAGSGKTYTALVAAMALKNGGRVALIDTERGSAAKYSDLFDFDTLDMREAYPRNTFDPANYIEAIRAAEAAGYDVVIVDSISPEWEGEGGILEKHDAATKRTGNSWTAWKDMNKIHDQFVSAMLDCRCHLIATMRSKMEHTQVKNEKTGKNEVEKLGMAPVQRNGVEYEFDVVGDMDQAHNLVISKTRCHLIVDVQVYKPNGDWFQVLKGWLSDGAPQLERKAEQAPATTEGNGNGHTEPQRTRQPWVDDPRAIKAFLEAAMASTTLSRTEILEACKVQDLSEFVGTKAEAKADIDAWIGAKVTKTEPEPETEKLAF